MEKKAIFEEIMTENFPNYWKTLILIFKKANNHNYNLKKVNSYVNISQ